MIDLDSPLILALAITLLGVGFWLGHEVSNKHLLKIMFKESSEHRVALWSLKENHDNKIKWLSEDHKRALSDQRREIKVRQREWISEITQNISEALKRTFAAHARLMFLIYPNRDDSEAQVDIEYPFFTEEFEKQFLEIHGCRFDPITMYKMEGAHDWELRKAMSDN
jgi:hypothetical protein